MQFLIASGMGIAGILSGKLKKREMNVMNCTSVRLHVMHFWSSSFCGGAGNGVVYVLITQSQKVRGAQDSREKQRSERRGERRQRSKKTRKQRNSGKEKVGVQENCIFLIRMSSMESG